MALCPKRLCCRGANDFAGFDADLSGGAVRVAGIDCDYLYVAVAALDVPAANGDGSSLHAIGCKHGGCACRLIGHGDREIELAAALESGFYGGKTKAAGKIILRKQVGKRGRWINHVRLLLYQEEGMFLISERALVNSEFLKMQHVNVARGEAIVLHDVNLEIETGEHVAILGPNGCGKSTLIKTITCECYPIVAPGTSIRLLGRERWDVSQLRRHLGVVEANLPGERTGVTRGIEAVVAGFFSASTLWPNLHVEPEMWTRAHAALDLMQAGHLAEKLVGQMSAGEQRRIMIARALVHEPEMLLLDEPSNALDMAAQRELREALRHVAQQGTGIVMVTHHLADILPEIDRVIMMRAGRIFADGTRDQLITAEKLRELFGVEVTLTQRDGYWHSW